MLSQNNNTGTYSSGRGLHTRTDNIDVGLWHIRVGHALHELENCSICPLAKHTRLPFNHSTNKVLAIFNLLHIDIWNPYHVPTYDGNKIFLTIVDDHSKITWLFLLILKSDTIVVLRQFLKMVQTQFNKTTKVIRSDNGSEFVNTECSNLFDSYGIIHQRTYAYTPQQNGVAERKHRHILEMASGIRFQGNIPLKFWGHCVLAATYLINRLPSTVLNSRSPYEVFYGRKPTLDHIRIMRCLCYAKNMLVNDKFDTRAIEVVMMGYSATSKGYILLNLINSTFFVNRDVIFKESVFPFQSQSTKEIPLFQHCDVVDPFQIESSVADHTTLPATPAPLHSTIGSPVDPPAGVLRQSGRLRKQPTWMTNFIIASVTLPDSSSQVQSYSINSSMSYTSLSATYRSSLATFTSVVEPKTFQEASTDPLWVEAVKSEITALPNNNTCELVPLPPGKVSIGCKWVFKVKSHVNGEVEGYKARLVAKGYTQLEGLDYYETFSPVVKIVIVRALMSIVASAGWVIEQMDVHNTFL